MRKEQKVGRRRERGIRKRTQAKGRETQKKEKGGRKDKELKTNHLG
jgi:hypothetical protein